jgi:uncharacterized protein YkwD
LDINKPDLTEPTNQLFSVFNIELGDTKEEAEQQLGPSERTSLNEYGTMWHAYHNSYENFVMLTYNEENHVAGIYTNQDLLSSVKDIKHGVPRDFVQEKLGSPLERVQKGLTFYQLPSDRDYDLFRIDGSYVSIFYDKHHNDTVTAIQIISEELEQERVSFYTESSSQLKEGFEYQLFDLTNATRVKHDLSVLDWDERVRETARNHSIDMADHNYFSHTNLAGQSPFDRMQQDNILFSVAGENLAYGQTSSVFAHEGLMNSLGHRENILKAEYTLLGVGVAFNSSSQPYFTQNFYTKAF